MKFMIWQDISGKKLKLNFWHVFQNLRTISKLEYVLGGLATTRKLYVEEINVKKVNSWEKSVIFSI